jgi:hypothetical protein
VHRWLPHTCAEIRGLKFSGLFAWLLWRGIYLSKLPDLERKVRVLTDWTLELFFPPRSGCFFSVMFAGMDLAWDGDWVTAFSGGF